MKRAKRTNKEIIKAALELFVRKGYHATSIDEITRKVGVTKGALYFHFRSKGDLLLRIIEEFDTQYIDPMIQSVTEYQGDALEKLNRAISFSSNFALENLDLCVFLTFLTIELKADVDFEPVLQKVYSKYQKFISGLINVGISQRLINKEFDPLLAALVFIAIHDGILHQWVLNRHHLDGRQYDKTFRKILLNGLKA